MLKKTITYVDYNNLPQSEDFYFNLNEAELAEMQFSASGSMLDFLNQIVNTRDVPEIGKLFKKLILMSYGKKSLDGRRFVKSEADREEFEQTRAYSNLFMELINNPDAAAEFFNGLVDQGNNVSQTVSPDASITPAPAIPASNP